MKRKGFDWLDDRDPLETVSRKVFYIDKEGKDRVGDRWRVSLYYHPNFAATIFFSTETAYNKFILNNEPFCFSDYNDFHKAYFY